MVTPRLLYPSPRSRRSWLTLLGSVLLHGSIIAVAAMWPVRAVPPPQEQVIPLDGVDLPGDPMPPAAPANRNLPPEEEATPPPSPREENVADTPPPSEEIDMTLSPAPPRSAAKPAESRVHPARSSVAAVMTRGGRAQPGVPGGGASAGIVGIAGNAGHAGAVGRWNTPAPVYPSAMRASHVQGNGSVRITTGGTGRVVSVSVVQSTGNAVLDDTTGRFARGNWSGPPNASTTVPITYQLR